MKTNAVKCLASILTVALLAGCAATRSEIAADAISRQLQPSAGMKNVNVTVVVEDKRPSFGVGHYGTSDIERPEQHFVNTIDLAGYTVDYLSRTKLFRNVSTVPGTNCCTLKLIWTSSRLNLNAWIPFVLRFQNHMTINMVFSTPDGKVLWTYLLDGDSVNTPSSFRNFSTHRCDIFQEKVLERLYPLAFRDMCEKLADTLK